MKWQLLHKACWSGDAAEVQRLLSAGADPNQVAPTNWRQTPLGRTLEFRVTHPKHKGHVEVVRVLLENGADPAVRSTYLDMTPYELASFCGLEAAAEVLRGSQSKAPPHPFGMTKLWLAAASRSNEDECLEAVLALLPSCDLHTGFRKATALMMAVGHAGHFRVADLLLERGADPNAGPSILHASCDWHFQHLVPAIRYLKGRGWNPAARDADEQTALHKAAMLGYAAAVRVLLELGADPTQVDASGATPLDLARRWNRQAVIRLLAGAGRSAAG